MKTKHIFIPIYLVSLTLSSLQLCYNFDAKRFFVLDLLAVLFMTTNITVATLFLLERVYTNWNNKIIKK